MSLLEYSLNRPGRMYGSAMPFGIYDDEGTLYEQIKTAKVAAIVVLAETSECGEKAKRDLLAMYQADGIDVIHLPIPNYGIPDVYRMTDAVAKVLEWIEAGKDVVVHCSAGLGRTALFLTLLARVAFGFSGTEGIAWLGQQSPRALLTPAQIAMILDPPCCPNMKDSTI